MLCNSCRQPLHYSEISYKVKTRPGPLKDRTRIWIFVLD
ncbi:hypothetical protein D7V86_02445 [bacterium D16-51]|nr:hypothetical protein D7V96_01870 [bacterium D16-59]RKI62397.1 hypothetical protein D7V86_02445 [bacterium D16-51]